MQKLVPSSACARECESYSYSSHALDVGLDGLLHVHSHIPPKLFNAGLEARYRYCTLRATPKRA
jgi:hypothetical protein